MKDDLTCQQNVYADTCICSYIMREQPEAVRKCLEQAVLRGHRIVVSAITYSEMRFGATGPKASPRHVLSTTGKSLTLTRNHAIQKQNSGSGSRHGCTDFQNAVDDELHTHTDQKEPHQTRNRFNTAITNQAHDESRTAQAQPQYQADQEGCEHWRYCKYPRGHVDAAFNLGS